MKISIQAIRNLGMVALLASPTAAISGTITSVGAVSALNHPSQLTGLLGTADFEGGSEFSPVALNEYTGQGMTFHTGAFASILPGVTQLGNASQPYRIDTLFGDKFPNPLPGAEASGYFGIFAGVVTFSDNVTQFGLTASDNGPQHITAWDQAGILIGQVNWTPSGDSAFVGIDTGGVPIGMLSYGNDDVFAGETYDVGGSTVYSDTWKWAGTSVPDSGTTFAMLAAGLIGMAGMKRKMRRA